MTKKILFCDKWEFSKQPFGTEYSDDFAWENVDVPHDWLIYDTGNLYETSTGWYRKTFEYSGENRTYIRFEGVYMDSKVYVNGQLAGEWKYGYSTFEFEITDLLKKGKNLVAVMVNHKEPNSRWYSGAGIYRSVWLIEKPAVNLVSDGIYVTAKKENGNKWKLICSAETDGETSGMTAEFSAYHKGELICKFSAECVNGMAEGTAIVEDPPVWDIEAPRVCRMEVELSKDGVTVDSDSTDFGFRTIEFTADKGFFLNGRHVKIHGCCEHHDLGALGAAINRSALEYRLDKLRTMGINAIRTSHNMPSVELMELADEKGFLILSESFDMWITPKTAYDYARFFNDWVEKDVASWVRRDRSHPSLIGWSIGNEIYDTHTKKGVEITVMLRDLVRKHDFRNNAYVTIGSNYMQWENAQKCADELKLAGYNYAERLYNEHHKAHPDWAIYGSETSSVVHSRGIYHFPLSHAFLTNDDEQCSSLGNCTTGWAAKNTEACIIDDRDAEFCAGQFIWTGFDYIGEPTPYHTKNSYFGQIDTAGFEKDSFYLFKAEWTDYKKDPFVHIFPYWSFNEGEIIDVRVCSNAPKVELFFNGKSQGAFDIDHQKGRQLTADYRIPYEKGTLEAKAYDENGKVIASDVQKSFGDCCSLGLKASKNCLKANGEDVAFVEISAFDKDGTFVANANNRAFVKVEGAARLLGLDNGDSTDYDQYKTSDRRLFSGKLMAVIASTKEPGDIKISVSSKGVQGDTIELKSVSAPVREGISCGYSVPVSAEENADDIPVRFISLEAQGRELTPQAPELVFKVKALPENNTVSELEFAAVTFRNIKSPIADCRYEDGKLTVTAKGNGDIKLRAMSRNNDERIHIISEVTFRACGFELTRFDPYELVVGGLYTKASPNLNNGIEKGISFPGGKLAFAGYENVDMGDFGSDTITVPIFANTDDPVYISFYDGSPEENGELLGKFSYCKPHIWLTYQPETYKLSKRLSGLHDIYIASDFGFEVKGFEFEKQFKEFSVLYANQADNIYGDHFLTGETDVTEITNNVCFEFGEFDFSERSPSSLTICGRTELPVNSIHLSVKTEDENRILCEFRQSDDYSEQTFKLPEISGKCRINLIFLPGSRFDMKWIRFDQKQEK